MKKLITLLFLASFTFGQTTISEADIDAAAGNRYETLLTNVEWGYNDACIQSYLQKLGFVYSSINVQANIDNDDFVLNRFEKLVSKGEGLEPIYVYYKLYKKKVPEYDLPMTTKVEIWGDPLSVIKFYVGFWTRVPDFENIKEGEVVKTRFLTDVSVLSYKKDGSPIITVTTAKDYYNVEE